MGYLITPFFLKLDYKIRARTWLSKVSFIILFAMSDDIVKVISLLSDSKSLENFKNCLRVILEYPRKVITKVLTKLYVFLTEDVRLRAQHRQLSQKLKEACVKVLEYIDLTESLQSMVDDNRIQLIFAEITDCLDDEPFDIQDRRKFPQTIDFLEELEMRLTMVLQKHREVKKCCNKLFKGSKEASAIAQTAESESKWWKYGSRAGGALSVIGGGALLLGGTIVTGGLGLALAGGGALGSYLLSKEFAERERSLKEIKKKMDEINANADGLISITAMIERMGGSSKLNTERNVLLRRNILVSSMEKPLTDIFNILKTSETFDNEKKMVENISKY